MVFDRHIICRMNLHNTNRFAAFLRTCFPAWSVLERTLISPERQRTTSSAKYKDVTETLLIREIIQHSLIQARRMAPTLVDSTRRAILVIDEDDSYEIQTARQQNKQVWYSQRFRPHPTAKH